MNVSLLLLLLLLLFFLYCRCNHFNLFKRVVNVSLPFCFQRKMEQEMERKRKEKRRLVSVTRYPPVLDKDRLMKKLLLDYFHSRNRK